MIRGELLGKDLEVVAAENDSLVGLQGRIVDETKHTLRVRTDRGEKTLIKEQVTIRVGGVEMDGTLLTQRPEKRTKSKITRWQRKTPKR